MSNSLPEDLPEEAKAYIRTIDLQIASITGFSSPNNDYEHALAEQITQLRDLRLRVIRKPSIASLHTPRKRRIEESSPTEAHRAKASKRVRLVQQSECSTCLENHPVGRVITLKCCSMIYCRPCFCAWFEAALSAKQLPKCCETGIEPKEYPATLTKPLIGQYKRVVKEIEAERKLWCANMDCRAFIKVRLFSLLTSRSRTG